MVDPKDALTATEDGRIYLDGQRIVMDELRQLQAEVKAIRGMRMWTIFTGTLRQHANKMMFENSNDYESMRSGKMVLYALDVQENMLKVIEKAQINRPGKV